MKKRLISAAALFALVAFFSFATANLAQDYVASVFSFGHGSGSISASLIGVTTRYLAAFDGTVATTDNFKIVVSRAGTLKNLYWSAAASTLTGTNNTITVLKNGIATSLTVTWNTTTRAGFNLINSEPVVAGDVISVRIQLGTGSGSITRPTVSFEFLTPGGSASQWITSGPNIYYNLGNVGIGTSTPAEKLEISSGNLSIVGTDKGIKLYKTGPLVQIGELIESSGFFDLKSTSADNNLALRFYTTPSGGAPIERMRISGAGYVGIGAKDPIAALDVEGDFSLRSTRLYFAGAFNPTYYMQYITSGGLKFKVNNFESLFLDINGNAGIGTTTPGGYKLYVAGSAYSTGGWVSSDRRFKENIAAIQSPLQKVMRIQGVTYSWKRNEFHEKGFPDGLHHGVIAQDIEKILPEVVKEGPEGEKAVAYTELVPILVEAIKEQQGIIRKLVGTLEKHGIHVDVALPEATTKTDDRQDNRQIDKPTNSTADAIPDRYDLSANFPNPFNPSTTITFAMPDAGKVMLAVYNLSGELVQTLVDGEMKAGYHRLTFDASRLASGVYFYRLDAGAFSATRKMILQK